MRAIKQLPSALERHLDNLVVRAVNQETDDALDKLKYCMKISQLGGYDISEYKGIYQELRGGLKRR